MSNRKSRFPGRPGAKNGKLKARKSTFNLVKSQNEAAAKKSKKSKIDFGFEVSDSEEVKMILLTFCLIIFHQKAAAT